MSKINWIAELPTIRELGLQGYRMPQLADHYGVSRQRIKQILVKFIPEWHEQYGGTVLKQASEQARQAKWGNKEDTDLYRARRAKFRAKKYNAEKAGTYWDLDFGTLEWPSHCPILGIELDYFAETRQENSVSFDQHDPQWGYVNGNVKIMSWRANRIKNDGTAAEHRKIAEYLDKIDAQEP